MEEQRGRWGSRLGFILAAAGSAVGLGNIWKFPYITGENGGGLFVLIYLFCIGLVGIPIMMGEIMIGRAAQKQPVEAFRTLQGQRTAWASVGWLGVLAGFIILSYYIAVAGWAM
ncbi:MAG: sodium-dependent transporter, partial [Planctomycetota bacterium]